MKYCPKCELLARVGDEKCRFCGGELGFFDSKIGRRIC